MKGPRIAIYGRHSTMMQNPTSSADQAAACKKVVDYLGGHVVDVYLDPELSGYRRDRPSFRRMLEDVREGRIDVVVAEALDRLARDAEDVAWLGKKLKFDRVRMHTVTEGEIDDVKLAVAALLGSLFLLQLQLKTFRGMEAAVLAGRFAGGRAYGYSKVVSLDERGNLQPGVLEIHQPSAGIVRRIFREFARGRSSIQIATDLNRDGVPGPRGGQWNASTIRGDPAKAVGILNNPLYRGEMIWGRREWRKDPDSDRRERRYRLRDPEAWIRVAVPELRIVTDSDWEAVRAELERRSRRGRSKPPVHARRRRHLLSGLIRCNDCGSSYVISGKDYYRCAGNKERGNCPNSLSVRKERLETMVLSILQSRLLTPKHVEVFAAEFKREVARLEQDADRATSRDGARLADLEREISNLTANLVAGIVAPTIQRLLADRELERDKLLALMGSDNLGGQRAPLPSEEELLRMFEYRVAELRRTIDTDEIRVDAADILAGLIDKVVIHPSQSEKGAQGEVVASAARLIVFATNAKGPPLSGGPSTMDSSIKVVAGVGFEPTTFRL